MGFTEIVLKEVLEDTAPDSETMRLVRERRNEILRAAERYLGALRTYTSGSVAHGLLTAIQTPMETSYSIDDHTPSWDPTGKARDRTTSYRTCEVICEPNSRMSTLTLPSMCPSDPYERLITRPCRMAQTPQLTSSWP